MSYIHINGLDLFASGLTTNADTQHVRLENVTANYAAGWSGLARISGRRHLISHNTFQDSGRDLLGIGSLSESLIQYNVLSGSGRLAFDLGMTYGHTTDFRNTVIRRNWVLENHAEVHPMGVYFDPVSRNVIVYENVVWNVGSTPFRVNNPSYFVLFFNNTAYRSGQTGTFDWAERDDLYGTMYVNNILSHAPDLPANVVEHHNHVSGEPGLIDAANRDFRLQANSPAVDGGVVIKGVNDHYTGKAPDVGPYQSGTEPWVPGHNFAHRPNPTFSRPVIEHMNLVDNACFDTGDLEGWQSSGDGQVGIAAGNGWGDTPKQPTGTGRHELVLGPGLAKVSQCIAGLEPGQRYQASAWVRVDVPEQVCLTIEDLQGQTMVEVGNKSMEWERLSVLLETGSGQTDVVFSLRKATSSTAKAYAANLGLQKLAKGQHEQRRAVDKPY